MMMPLRFGAMLVVFVCAVLVVCGGADASTTSVEPTGREVGVRINKDKSTGTAGVITSAKGIIDYETFEWRIFDGAAFDQLVANGMTFSTEPVDYRLTLGGVSFDPKFDVPNISQSLKSTARDDATIRLLQVNGPTKSEWVDAIEAAGLWIVQYVHPLTYIVWGDANAVESLREQPWLRWSGNFEPAYALLPAYRGLTGEGVLTRLLVVEHADQASIAGALKALGATGIDFGTPTRSLINVHLSVDAGRYAEIATIPGVYSVKPIPLNGGPRGEMSSLININSVNGSNQAIGDYPTWLGQVDLDGAGVIIAAVEAGQQTNHPDLTGQYAACSGTTCTGNSFFVSHGTHVAGILAGDGASGTTDGLGFLRALGVAPGSALLNQFWTPHFVSADGMLLIMRDSFNNGASISSNAWGPAGAPQGYDDDTRQVDVGVRDVDSETPGDQALTYILSILNGGGGTSSLGSPDEGKNLINVGSTKMQTSTGAQILDIDDVSSNSGHGPALDGRKVPHIVAPGCNVDGAISGSGYSVSNSYCGTSFASPQVSGGLALFIERYRLLPDFVSDPSPALLKAALLAVASSLEGNDDADGVALGAPFDNKQGYGRFDLEAMVDPQDAVLYFDQDVVLDNTSDEWSVDVVPDNPAAPMRIMLVWTDAPGHGLGGITAAWNNDLDLTVIDGGSTYRGNVIASGGFSTTGGVSDNRNNTEAVFLGPTPPASATIRVTAANINSNGLPNSGDATDQDFAIACYNCVLVPVVSCPTTLGDLTGMAGVNGADIGGFLSCYLGGAPGAPGCGCADMNESNGFEQVDIDMFVDCLLGLSCP